MEGAVFAFIAALVAELLMLLARWLFGGVPYMRFDHLGRDITAPA